MRFDNQKIADILLAGDYITKKEIFEAKKVVSQQHIQLDDYLLSKNLISKNLLGQAIAEYFNVSFIDLGRNIPDKETVLKLPEEIAYKYNAILIEKTKDKASITTDNPKKHGLKEATKQALKISSVTINYSSSEDIRTTLAYYKKKLATRFSKIIEKQLSIAPDILNEIFNDAILFGASDIHFEPEDEKIAIRFRIDGVLREAGHLPKKIYGNILNRIKILSHLRIDEHDVMQDGGVQTEVKDQVLNMRISIVPTVRGEKIVARILSHYVKNFTFEDLGISENNQQILTKAAQKPFGMIIVAGPTGSGKTTSLYSVLKFLNNPEINITTIEDPVEYRIPGVNQIQVDDERGITFAKGLRSIIRQDPDAIFVGEIRDKETVDISLNAALTGHLLLSSFHANNSSAAIPRLLFMGAEAFLLSSTLELIIAQRLVRRICEQCKVSVVYKKEKIKKVVPQEHLKFFPDKETRLYYGKGHTDKHSKVCAACNGLGYKGRIGIFEFLEIDKELKALILEKPSAQHIWQIAQKKGAESMFEDGINKVKEGLTTIEEVVRVAGVEALSYYNEDKLKKHEKNKKDKQKT